MYVNGGNNSYSEMNDNSLVYNLFVKIHNIMKHFVTKDTYVCVLLLCSSIKLIASLDMVFVLLNTLPGVDTNTKAILRNQACWLYAIVHLV